jgi:hypothetical protein
VLVDATASLRSPTACIRNNGSYGASFEPTLAGRTLTVTNCSINANGSYGIRSLAGSAGSVTVTNSIITNHTSYGVARSDSSTVTTSHSDVWNNATANFLRRRPEQRHRRQPALRLADQPPPHFELPRALRRDGRRRPGRAAVPHRRDPGLYGTLWVPTTLALAGSPYAVAGDLTVAPGVTLSIAAGVTLTFATTDVMGAGFDTNRAELLVAGTLLADATPASPINLTAASPSPGAWYGLELLPSAAGSTIDNVVVSYPVRGLNLAATGANTLSAITVTSASQYGLYAVAGAPTVDGFVVDRQRPTTNGVLVDADRLGWRSPTASSATTAPTAPASSPRTAAAPSPSPTARSTPTARTASARRRQRRHRHDHQLDHHQPVLRRRSQRLPRPSPSLTPTSGTTPRATTPPSPPAPASSPPTPSTSRPPTCGCSRPACASTRAPRRARRRPICCAPAGRSTATA